MRIILYCLLLGFATLIQAKTYMIRIGCTPVSIIKYNGHGKTFVHLHQNEVTALRAAKEYISHHGGSLITLRHAGRRNIVFCINRNRYEFDPNRIFTDSGIRKTLKQFGPYNQEAHREVKKFAKKILSLLPKNKKIIAVHNNNKEYSLREYFPDHPLAKDAKAFHYSPKTSFRNFYFVTQTKEYYRLKKLNFNVVLQARRAQDDGSLSYYLKKNNYINIEAAYNYLHQQIKMLQHA